jgi:transcriptional regulator with XRE-family HTH domain
MKNALRKFRIRAGLTQEQLEAKTGIQQSHISELERLPRRASYTTVVKLAKALGVKPEQLGF